MFFIKTQRTTNLTHILWDLSSFNGKSIFPMLSSIRDYIEDGNMTNRFVIVFVGTSKDPNSLMADGFHVHRTSFTIEDHLEIVSLCRKLVNGDEIFFTTSPIQKLYKDYNNLTIPYSIVYVTTGEIHSTPLCQDSIGEVFFKMVKDFIEIYPLVKLSVLIHQENDTNIFGSDIYLATIKANALNSLSKFSMCLTGRKRTDMEPIVNIYVPQSYGIFEMDDIGEGGMDMGVVYE